MRAVIRTFGNHCHNKRPWKIFMKNWLITASVVLVCLGVSAHARPATDEAVIAALQAQVYALIARVERLEGRLEGRLGRGLERREQIAESSLTAPFAPTSARRCQTGLDGKDKNKRRFSLPPRNDRYQQLIHAPSSAHPG